MVTAEKRDTTVQKSGLSITALGGAALRAAGLTDVQSVAQQVPGVSFKTGGPGQTELQMRGLNSSGGNSPTVGFYLDETPLTTFAFATAGKVVIDPDLYDLDRIEVLRGPQGTLYGGGSMGGTIRLISAQPQMGRYAGSAELIGSATQGGKVNGSANLMLNLPLLGDVVALRLVGTEKYVSGWIDRKALSDFPLPTDPSGVGYSTVRGDVRGANVAQNYADVNSRHLQGIRGTLLIKPSTAFSVSITGMYQTSHANGQSLVDANQVITTLESPAAAQYRSTGAQYQPIATAEPVDDTFKMLNVTAKYDLGSVLVTSVSAWWDRKLSQVQDGAEVMQAVLSMPSYYTSSGGLGASPWVETDTAHQFSQELRFTSSNAGPFQWQLGGFYSHLRSVLHQYANYSDPYSVANFATVDPYAVSAQGIATMFDQQVNQLLEQKAVFGEASYEFARKLKFTAGLRYFDYRSHSLASEFGLFAPEGDLTPKTTNTVEHDHGFNPKFNLTWRPNGDHTVYATISRGFRPGGANEVVPTQGVAAGGTAEGDACRASLSSLGRDSNSTSYQPDSVWNYEMGQKARLLGGRLTLNTSAYYERWSNIQRSITLGCAYIYSDNAGSANIYGAEAEVSFKLTRTLSLSANLGYTHATYSDVYMLPALDGSNGLVSRTGVQNGQRLPDVPEFTTTQTISWRTPISNRLTLTALLTNSFTGPRQETTSAFTNGSGNSSIPVNLPSYDLIGARIGVASDNGWGISIFGDNLTDNQAPLSAINSQVLNITPVRRLTVGQPRTIGLRLTSHW